MRKIVVIGGGEIKDLETLAIDKQIVALTNKKHPKALFIPTASGDDLEYSKTFDEVYGKKLGCITDNLFLLREKLTHKEIAEKILNADLIYVGGGNTLRMLKRWRKLGVDKLLKQAYAKGVVLSGISAGGICWFEYGQSDSMRFKDPKRWKYIRIKGLGLLPGIHCPHYHEEKREKDFERMIQKHSGIGIALDDNTALEVIDDKYRIITSKNSTHAYKLYKKNGKVIMEKIEHNKYLDIKNIYV